MNGRRAILLALIALVFFATACWNQMHAAPRYDDAWWNASWHYRMRIDVNTTDYSRTNWPVEKELNITSVLVGLNITGTFDSNSIRVVEYNASGSILREMPSQFDLADNFNASTNANGELVFILNGTNENATTRYFYVYFDITQNGNKPQPSYASPMNYTWDNVTGETVINNSKFLVYIDTAREDNTSGIYRVYGIASETEWFFESGPDNLTMEYTQLSNGSQDFGFNLANNATFTMGPVRIRMRQYGNEVLWNTTNITNQTRIVKDYYFYPNSSWVRINDNITNIANTSVNRSSNAGISAFDVARAYEATYKVMGDESNPGSWIRGTYSGGGPMTGFIHINQSADVFQAMNITSPDRIGINMNITTIANGTSLTNAFAMVFGDTVSTPTIMEDMKDRLVNQINITQYSPERWAVLAQPNTAYQIYNRNESVFVTGNVTFDPWNITQKVNVTLDMGNGTGPDDQTLQLAFNASYGNQTAGYRTFTGYFSLPNISTTGYWNITVKAYDISGYYLNESYYLFNVTSVLFANLTFQNALGLPSRTIYANLDVKNYRQDAWIPGAAINCSYGGTQVTNITNNGNGTYSINFTAPVVFGLYTLNCSASKDGNLGYEPENFTVEAAKTNVSISRNPQNHTANNVTLYYPENFSFNVTLENTGNSSAYSMNITLSLPSNWTASPANSTCGDIPILGSCVKAFNITVPKNTSAAANYLINVSANWTNLDTTTSFNTTYVNVTVSQNPRLEVPQDNLSGIMGPGNTTLIGSFTVNSTGNYPLSTIGFSVSGLNGFVIIFSPPSIASLGIGQTQPVQVTVIVPSDQSPGIYSGVVNASSSNDGFDLVNLTIIVTGTNMSINKTPENFTANVTYYQNDTFVLHAESNNTGNVTAFYASLNLSLPAGWTANASSYACGNVSKGGVCSSDFMITVLKGTPSGYYLVNVTMNWMDIGIGPRSNSTSVNVTVLSNTILMVSPGQISSSVEHGTNKLIGMITLNSTGNDPVSNITFNTSGFTNITLTFVPPDVSTLAGGNVQNVLVNATIPAGYDPGIYNATVNVTSGGYSHKAINVSITVPQNGSWSMDRTYCEHVQSPNEGYVCNVTVNNTGNLPLNFSIFPATSPVSMSNYSWTNVTSFLMAKQSSYIFSVLYNVTGVAGTNWKNSNYTIDPQDSYASPNSRILEIKLNPNLNPLVSIRVSPTKAEQTSYFIIYSNVSSQSGMGISYVIANVTRPDGTSDSVSMNYIVGGGCYPPGAYTLNTCWYANYSVGWGQTVLRGNYSASVTAFDNSVTNETNSTTFQVYTRMLVNFTTGSSMYAQGDMGYINYRSRDFNYTALAGTNTTISITNPNGTIQGIIFPIHNYSADSSGWADPLPYFTLTNDAPLGNYTASSFSTYYDSTAGMTVNSTNQVQFTVQGSTSQGIAATVVTTVVWYPNSVMSFAIEVHDSNFNPVDPDQLNLTVYAGSPLLNNIYLQVNLSSAIMRRMGTGHYIVSYAMPANTATGDYWAEIRAVRGSLVSPTVLAPFRVSQGGPYDVRLRVLNSEVAKGGYLDFEITVENMGEAGQDVDMTYWVSDGTQTWSMASEAVYTPAHQNLTVLRSLFIFRSQNLGLHMLNLLVNYSNISPIISKNTTFMVVEETVQPPQPPQPPGGGTGQGEGQKGGGGGEAGGGAEIKIIQYPDGMGVESGVSRTVNLVIKNVGSADAKNINISLSGLDASWFRLSDTSIALLKSNDTTTITLQIQIPGGTKSGEYMVKVKAEGQDTSDQKLFKVTVFTSRKDLVEFELARLKAKTDELEMKANQIKVTHDVDAVLKYIPEIRAKIAEAEGYLSDSKIDAALGSIYAGWELYDKAAALLQAATPRITPELIPMWLLIVVLLMVGFILFLVVVLRKLSLNMRVLLRGRYSEARTVTGIVKKEPEIDNLRVEKDKLQRMLSLLESQYKQGIISKEAFDGLRTSSEAKMKALDERIRKELKV